MPRKALHSGQYNIEHARDNFEASIKAGAPDYRMLALAIGSSPIAPPHWAVSACIEEKEREEKRAASATNGDTIELVLDELVRFYDREQQFRLSPSASKAVPCSSLRAALIVVFGLLGRGPGRGNADDNWLRTARRAWEREQIEDRKRSHFVLGDWHITGRIERVLMAIQGPEFGYPADPVKALWLNHQNKSRQDQNP